MTDTTLCPICLKERSPNKSRCDKCTKLKLPINITLDCEHYPYKHKNGK